MNAALPAGHEFSDRLNPFLVKELRQGLRGRGYLALFLLLILVLTIQALFAIDIREGAYRNEMDGLFRAITVFTLAVLLPLNLLGAIHEERRGRKIELVMLSRVSARGVVFGKWLVVVLQAATLTSLVAPFVVFRYFSGGTNFLNDIAALLAALFAGMIYAAATLCASSFIREGMTVIAFLIRAGLIGGGFILGGTLVGVLFDSSDAAVVAGVLGIAMVLTVPTLLEIAAGRLAPEAVNHDGIIRLMGLAGGLLAAGAILLWASPSADKTSGAIWTAYLYALIAGTFTLFETRSGEIRHTAPLDRLGMPGRALGRLFLMPGGASGLAFLLLLPAPVLLSTHSADPTDNRLLQIEMLAWGAIVWPLVVLGFFRLRPSVRFSAWLGLQLVGTIVAIMINIRFDRSSGMRSLACLLPTTGLLTYKNSGTNDAFLPSAIGFGLTCAGAILVLLVNAVRKRT